MGVGWLVGWLATHRRNGKKGIEKRRKRRGGGGGGRGCGGCCCGCGGHCGGCGSGCGGGGCCCGSTRASGRAERLTSKNVGSIFVGACGAPGGGEEVCGGAGVVGDALVAEGEDAGGS